MRVRGLLPAERHVGGRAILRVLDRKVVVVMDPGITAADDYLRLNKSKEKRYAFDYVFDENCGQTEAIRQLRNSGSISVVFSKYASRYRSVFSLQCSSH